MVLTHPSRIGDIDRYAEQKLGISVMTLMERAGRAVADAVRSYTKIGSRVSIFAGKGNNGGDGYAAALDLIRDYDVTVYDVFSMGQRSAAGQYFLSEFMSNGGVIEPLDFSEKQITSISSSSCVVDAVFGTGLTSDLPDIALKLSRLIATLDGVTKIAVDVPLGVNSSDGSINHSAVYRATATVVLGFMKTGLVSYPALEYVGDLIFDNIGLQYSDFEKDFSFDDYRVDRSLAVSLVPERGENTNKGSFGKLLMITGSKAYRGAAFLSLEAALRFGVGFVTFAGEESLCDSLLSRFPEAIYKRTEDISDITSASIDDLSLTSAKHSAVLAGCGSSVSDGLLLLLKRLLSEEGAPLVLDADAINAIASEGDEGRVLIRNARRAVILTPHPLELSRLAGISLAEIQERRYSVANEVARDLGCVLVLKGAATIATDGKTTYINSSGSSALAKAGSGDVLAGALASMVASGHDPLKAAALTVYLHGLAADALAEELSEFGVTPSDLPREMARQLAALIHGELLNI